MGGHARDGMEQSETEQNGTWPGHPIIEWLASYMGGQSEPGVCYECRHYTPDPKAAELFGLNFPVGRCAKGMSISHGVVRCHDTCTLFAWSNEPGQAGSVYG